MLEYITLVAKGRGGKAACRCVVRQERGCSWTLHLLGVATPCIAVVGDDQHHYTHRLEQDKDMWETPILSGDIWVAVCSTQGSVLAWATRMCGWSAPMGMALCALFDDTPTDGPKLGSVEEKGDMDTQATDRDDEACHAEEKEEPIASPSPEASATPDKCTQNEGDVCPKHDTCLDDDELAPDRDNSTYRAAPIESENKDPRPVPTAYSAYFEQYPPCLPLARAVPDGKWVQVDQDDYSYVLGVLYTAEGVPTHLCYGVEGSADRPLREGHWVETANGGYWLIYTPIEA